VVGQSQYLAVQFDREHKIAARLIASDAQKDVALLWANMGAFPAAHSTGRAIAAKRPPGAGGRSRKASVSSQSAARSAWINIITTRHCE